MSSNKDHGIESLELLAKDGYSYLINNAGKIIALITVIICATVTFTDVSLTAFGSESFTVNLFIMLLASYIMYFSLEGSGQRLGEESEEYISASKKYKEVRSRITPDMTERLRDFCLDYSFKDAEYRRRLVLMEAGLSEQDYIEYKSGRQFGSAAKRALKKCERIKPPSLTPTLLLSSDRADHKDSLRGLYRSRLISVLSGLLPTTLGSLFTVSVILTAKGELTPSVIIEGIVKLSALPIIGFKGYSAGYAFVKRTKVSRMLTKAEILEEFLA